MLRDGYVGTISCDKEGDIKVRGQGEVIIDQRGDNGDYIKGRGQEGTTSRT